MPPPMKLTEAMVDAMGGLNSTHYAEYRHLCYTTFLHLRRHANVVLNLFALMTSSSLLPHDTEVIATSRHCRHRARAGEDGVQSARTLPSERVR